MIVRSHAIDYTKPPHEVVIDLINADNGTQLTADHLKFGYPTALASNALRNTSVVASAKPNTLYRGNVTLFYNRIPLSIMAEGRTTDFHIGTARTWAELMPQINFRFGINLTTADYVDGPLNVAPEETLTSLLQIKATSLVYLGELALVLNGPTSAGIPLSSVITDPYLDTTP